MFWVFDSLGRQIMSFIGYGEPPTPPHPTSSEQKQGPVTQYYVPSKSHQKPPSPSTSNSHHPVVGAFMGLFRSSKTAPVLFYNKNDPFYEFTNFSPHDVHYKKKRYPTSEHLFQALKFLGDYPDIAERIRTCGERPMLAFDEAHRHQKWVRSDWRQVSIDMMEIALYHKFTQHSRVKALLLGTGDADLIEDSPRDYFWGIGADRSGRNELGKALVRLRKKLCQSQDNLSRIHTARLDATRLSVQELAHPMSAQQFFSVPSTQVSSSGPVIPGVPVIPRIPLLQDSGLCEYCRARPKFQNHPYCGRTCAAEASRA